MTQASIVVAVVLVTLVGAMRMLFGTAPRVLADLGFAAAAVHYALLVVGHSTTFVPYALSGVVAAAAVLARPLPGASRRARFPVLLSVATVLGLWFGLAAPHVSPVTPPTPPTPSAQSATP
jgi:hypothetical protein